MNAKQYLMPIAAFICPVLLLVSTDFAGSTKPIAREEVKVVVDGVEEVWRLEWLTPPRPVCGPEDDDWMTCPCEGFAFGEWGDFNS